MAIRLLFLRHARTAANASGRSQGRADNSLDEFGERQAEALAGLVRELGPTRVVSSPAQRARQTAAPVARDSGVEIEVDERLHEVDQGLLDGLTGVEMRERHPEFMVLWSGEDIEDLAIPGGESLGDAQRRMVEAVDDILSSSEDGAVVAVVTHNLALRAYLCSVLGVPVSHFRRLRTDLASLSVVEVGEHGPILVALNEACGLPA
ncbi:MAG: histidine phosphatase family protein [Dehalococcoidia bacterium]